MATIHRGEGRTDPLIRVLFWSPELLSGYEADVSPDITAAEILSELTGPAANSWLRRIGPNERCRLTLLRTGKEIRHTLTGARARKGDRILVTRETHGAGPGVLDVATGLAAAKLTIDAARVGIDAYRARTERLAVDLEREMFESEDTWPDPPPDEPGSGRP
jgi:hypothetical protein